MIDFMTALTVILVQLTCPGDLRAKGIQFQPTCILCRESHKTQVWLCFLVLSFLSISTCAASEQNKHLQKCLLGLNIETSDAMLYAPPVNDIEDKCKNMALKCYILELAMVLQEEEIKEINNHKTSCILDFNERLQPTSVGCRPCETYSLRNVTTFLEQLNNLLEKLNAEMNT